MGYPKFIEGLCQVTYDMWNKGWDEYNGGNVSYRLTVEEAENLESSLAGTEYTYYTDNRTCKRRIYFNYSFWKSF